MSGPTVFKVTERLGPLGTLAKLPIDYREAYLDFTRWLAPGETVASVAQHGIQADPEPSCNGSWSIAFDCSECCSAATEPPPDSNPLIVFVASVAAAGTKATLLIGQGTPGLTYAVSFLAVVLPSMRRKSVDIMVCVGTPMVDIQLPTAPPSTGYRFVTNDIDLAFGSVGTIFVNNTSGHSITITLPPGPYINQNLVIKDMAGNSAIYPIIIDAVGYTIDGRDTLVIQYDYGWAELTFTGTQWVQI